MKYLLLNIVFVLLFVACRKEKTSWNSKWMLPIVNDTLTLDNLVQDSILEIDGNGLYRLKTTQSILDLQLSDIISVPDTTLYLPYSISFNQLNLPPGATITGDLEEHDFSIPDVEIKKMKLSQGKIDIRIENPLADMVIYTVNMPGVTKNGNMFAEVYEVPSGTALDPGVTTAQIDVSGFEMDLTGTSGGKFNVLQTQIDVTTDVNGGVVTLTKNDTIRIYVDLNNVKVEYARGYFGSQIISDTVETKIDFLSKLSSGDLMLDQASVTLNIENGIKAPARSTIYFVENQNENKGTVSLNSSGQNGFLFGIPFNIDPATGTWNSLVSSYHSILFNELNSNLTQYIENVGSTQKIGYEIKLNPWGNTSGGWNEIFQQSKLKVDLLIDVPLNIGFNQLTLKDTFDFSISQNIDKTHLEEGSFILDVKNAFPYNGEVALYFLNENKTVIGSTTSTEKIESSLFGTSTTANNVVYKTSTLEFPISKTLVSNINAIKYVAISTTFNSPNPITVVNEKQAIQEGAFLGVLLKGNFNLMNKY